MASGAQDWVTRQDITAQTLAEIVNRPKYGAAQLATYSHDAAASGPTECIAFTGKGIIYSCLASCDGAATQKNDHFEWELDGVSMHPFAFSYLYDRSITNFFGAGWYLPFYDDATFRYVVAGGMGFTFETSLKLIYTETYNRTPALSVYFHYAIV